MNRLSITAPPGGAATVEALTLIEAGDNRGVATYEARDGLLSGTATVQPNAFAVGGNAVVGIGNGPANTLSFPDIHADKSGPYRLTVWYAHNDRSGTGNYNTNIASREALLAVNGAPAQRVVFRNTVTFDEFWGLPVVITQQAGPNTLSISNPDSAAPSINRIEVAPLVQET